VIVHREYMEKRLSLPGEVGVFWTEIDSNADVRSIASKVDALYKNSAQPTESVSASATLKTAMDAAKVIPNLLTGAGLLILLATFLVTVNTIAVTIRERTGEIAVLRAIGFRRSRILRMLMIEALLVACAGGFIGSIIPVGLFRGGVKMGGITTGSVELPPELIGWTVLTAAAVGVFAALVPAWRASQLDVVAALRHR
jgi:putative ABC transport system permease protein